MAITQISTIQHRTGNISDLPQLAVGELGWATDDRRLFIGNDPSFIGPVPNNTEILTQYTPNIQPQPAGASTTVQFNDNGDFAGSTNFTYDSGTNLVSVNGNVSVSGVVSAASITGNITGAFSGSLANGTSNVSIYGANGSVGVSVNSTANVILATSTGVNVNGNVTATSFTGNGVSLTNITSANVTYRPAGVGAVLTTAQTKLRETVSIADFGASPSATAATNAAAINAAIQAADSIFIPSGTYQCNTITLRSGVSIYGNGSSSVLQFPAGQTGMYGLSSSSGTYLENIALSNFKLLGAVVASGFSEFIHLVNVNGVRNMTVENVQFVGFQGDGLYLGAYSDNTRHNINVKVSNCLFDGVNKNNRNAISVIDCDNLSVKNSTFQNASRSNMPGFIDIEPNDNNNVVRNIQIIGNSFENTDAAEAAICIVIVNPTLTVAPETFVISNNTFNVNKRMVSFRISGTYTPSHNLIVTGNSGVVQTIGSYYPKINGGTFSNNTLTVTNPGEFGFANTDTINNLVISGNTFNGGGSANRAFSLRCGSGHSITGNVFSNFTTYGFLCGISGGTLSNTSITSNTFISCGTYAVGSAGGIDGVSCTFLNNIHSITHQFPAWRTDDTGNVTNGDSSPTTFNADNLPSAFTYEGIYRSAINGDTAVPSTGGYQGLLETHCEAGQNGNKWKYQLYYPSNNTVNVTSFYLRKGVTSSDTWTGWSEHSASVTVLSNYTALRAYTGTNSSTYLTQQGIDGYFLYDSTDTTSADNGGTIIVDSSGRRWKRVYTGSVMVSWFGSNATAINAALTVGAGNTVSLTPGVTYSVNATLNVPSWTVFDLNDATVVDSTGALEIIVNLAGVTNAVVKRGTIDGGVRVSIGPHCISGVAATNCVVSEVTFIRFGRSASQADSLGPSGTGVMFMANDNPDFVLGPTVGPSYGNTIEQCVFNDIRASFAGRIWSSWDYAGVTSECYGNVFKNNLILNIGKTACEIAGPKTHSCSAIDNTVINARIDGLDIDKGASRCIISGNKIYSVDRYPSYSEGLQFGGITVSSVNDVVGGLLQGDNNTVTNNIIYAVRNVGIRIAGALNTVVSNNHIVTFGESAISVENVPATSTGADNTLISGNIIGSGGSFDGNVITTTPTDIITQTGTYHVIESNILNATNHRGIWNSGATFVSITNNLIRHFPTATSSYAIYSSKNAAITGNTVKQGNSFVVERTVNSLGDGYTVSICNNTIESVGTYGILVANDATSNILIAGNTVLGQPQPIRITQSVQNLVVQDNMLAPGKTINFLANATTVVRQGKAAAIPNTTGATLAELETQVNTIKAALRSLSIISSV